MLRRPGWISLRCLSFGDVRGCPNSGVPAEKTNGQREVENERLNRTALEVGDRVGAEDEGACLGGGDGEGKGVLTRGRREDRGQSIDLEEHERRRGEDCHAGGGPRRRANDTTRTRGRDRLLPALVELQTPGGDHGSLCPSGLQTVDPGDHIVRKIPRRRHIRQSLQLGSNRDKVFREVVFYHWVLVYGLRRHKRESFSFFGRILLA